jgi:predicted O-linked N-acetylglucosamine transferase (SPINDLY family)
MAKPRLPPPAKNQKQPLSIAELGAKAEALEARNDRNGAAQLYRDWIKQSKSPLVWVAQFNLGVLLRNLGDLDGAVEAYKASLAINPKLPHARINLGTVLEVLNRPGEAIDEWKIALGHLDSDPKADPELVCTVLNNLGRRLEVMQNYTEAEEMLTRSLLLKPGQDAVLYHRIFLRQKQCAWPIYAPLPGISLEDQQSATSAVAMLSISDDPELQLRTALSQVPGKIPKDLPKLAPADGYTHDRLRIGYLSSNFGMHAVSILTAELYELHDRSRVEVWGFCWSPEDNTEMRERVIKAMDHFVRIKDMSDEEAAKAIRAAEIDVLIDLQGLTAGCRPKIIAYRPAPIQITYLGFPGTTALPEIDYVLADRYIIPEDMAKYFTEKPLYLPDCFQVNDRKRISSLPLSRAAYGLPKNAFVFCAFNNNIKFTPELFECWMRILQRTAHGVLWLLADNERARENLGRCADEHGVARERLIFAPRVAVADYLARFAVADLFLDLFPYNGGTTVADALWMGLPVVTLSGRSFASRMAGSLLTSIGLPELIATKLGDYEDFAVQIAHQPSLALSIRNRVQANKSCARLFDTPTLVQQIEDALEQVSGALKGELATVSGLISRNNINLYTIAYSEDTLLSVAPNTIALDNTANPRPDWREYWPMRQFLLTQTLHSSNYYGFLSPKFTWKTGLTGEAIKTFITEFDTDIDVFTFSPQADQSALFLNPFEQGEVFDPGLMETAELFLHHVGLSLDLKTAIMDSRQIVFSNYFVAKPAFWRSWLALCERIFAVCESGDKSSRLAQLACATTSYPDAVPRKVFLVERIASLLLHTQPWKVRPYSTFKCAWSNLPTGKFRLESVQSDALKIAYRETGDPIFLNAFASLRKAIFKV